jgi:hypothetical protein
MAEAVGVKPLGRTIVVSIFASELFDIAALFLLERRERTNQMKQRARAADYGESRCHHDDNEKGCLTRETAGLFILKIFPADRAKRRPWGAEATAAAVRRCYSLKAVIRFGERRGLAQLAIAKIAAALLVELDCWFHILIFPVRCIRHPDWIQNLCWRTKLLQWPCHASKQSHNQFLIN